MCCVCFVFSDVADADRLEASVAELSRAIEYARRARAEAAANPDSLIADVRREVEVLSGRR